MASETRLQMNGWRAMRWLAGAGLLLVPLVMMQIVDGWNWGPGGFLFAGIMIGGVLLLYEFAARAATGPAYRGGVAVALVPVFLIVWTNIAVGIVGEDDPSNFSFFMLLFAAAVGAFAARGEPAGMARAMLGVALVQLLLAIAIATAPSTAQGDPRAPMRVLVLSAGFAALWLAAAGLFWRAARGGGATA